MADEKVHIQVPWDEEAFLAQRKKKAKLPENTTYAATASALVRRDMQILALMLWIPLDKMVANHDHGISPEVPMNIQRAYAVMVKNATKAQKTVDTQKILKDADTCLQATNADSPAQAALAVAWVIVKLADEGQIPDPGNQIVLTAAGILQEAQEDGPTAGWCLNPDVTTQAGERLWSRANLAGYLAWGGI